VTAASQSVSDASASTLRTAEYTLDSPNCWTCQTCMDVGRHHTRSHLNTPSRTSASALFPTSPAGDHSASTEIEHHNICLTFQLILFVSIIRNQYKVSVYNTLYMTPIMLLNIKFTTSRICRSHPTKVSTQTDINTFTRHSSQGFMAVGTV